MSLYDRFLLISILQLREDGYKWQSSRYREQMLRKHVGLAEAFTMAGKRSLPLKFSEYAIA